MFSFRVANTRENQKCTYSAKRTWSERVIKRKANNLRLGSSLYCGDYFLVRELFVALGYSEDSKTAIRRCLNNGLPIRNFKFGNRTLRKIKIENFWKWAEANKDKISFAKFEQGALGVEPKWVKDSKGWWYDLGNGNYPKDKWLEIKNEWYYFDEKGYAYSNKWFKYKNKWYWFNEECKMVKNCILKINKKYYAFNLDGTMKQESIDITIDKDGQIIL